MTAAHANSPASCPACAARNRVRQDAQDRLAHLTPRQREIAELVGAGQSNGEIAVRLDISEKTVRNALTDIFDLLALERRTQLARLVWEAGEGT